MRQQRSGRAWWPWSSRAPRDEDLDKEIAAHLELEAEEFSDAGLSSEQARRAAHRLFGNAARAKEDTRAVWTHLWLERSREDTRFAARLLRVRRPSAACMAASTTGPPTRTGSPRASKSASGRSQT